MASLFGDEDDVIISLQEGYEGWVICQYPDCNQQVLIVQLEEHLLSHSATSSDEISDLEFARALQESEDQLISAIEADYQLALSLQNQETTYTQAKPNTQLATADIAPRTYSSAAKPTNYQTRGNSNYSYKPSPYANIKPGSNIHSLSSVTSSVKGKGRGEGGYTAQTLNKLEQQANKGAITSVDLHFKKLEFMENLNSGKDDLNSCTEGVLQSMMHSYGLFSPSWSYYLSLDTPHFSYSLGDRGWGCGYRNIQMIIGSLLMSDKYRVVMNRTFNGNVPTVPRLQELLDEAWRAGYDPQGAKSLGYKVRDTKTWIGATEAAVLFRSFGVKAEVVDFIKPPGSGNTHARLIQWVEDYFKRSTCITTDLPPVYLQHSGHSRTIIGWSQYRSNKYLTILDPMTYPDKLRKCVQLKERELVWLLSRISSHFYKSEYQIVSITGLIESHKKESYKIISPIQRLTH
ncbi:Zinc finger with UFM1-specific peptidase domain protein isoform X1 [Oopsacas minuta]|uniref:Zinc finger with UFM1-specific peptidase domain protein isoform X1 n=1 Tax=Oopsacas minuta TaxID=111878 RepID=A0AAV7JDU1_9METZ|nr:Zinc finger with UFM1-specific peptidase domain protein isoform X1 [Oopsacas minuta]